MSMRTFRFKTDASFLEKISLGATATRKVQDVLNGVGHNMIELERGSLSTDIWKEIKMKRIRVPDLICTRCGIRVECRGKSRLEMTMSHSDASPGRQWDAGLLDKDWIAFVLCHKEGERPTDWVASDYINIVEVGPLRAMRAKARIKAPKGATEGSEIQITWPSRVRSEGGRVISIGNKSIRIRTHNGHHIQARLILKNGIRLVPTVKVGDEVHGQDQFLASLAPLITNVECKRGRRIQDFIKELNHPEFSVRFAAARTLGVMKQ